MKKKVLPNYLTILVYILLIVLFIEIGLRFYIAPSLKKLPFMLSNIKGVPYVEVDFNDFDIEKNKPRIIVIGDYISIHKSFKEKKNYPEVLESKLNYTFEIINTGALFYSLPEEMNLLKNKALEFNPDIVVIGYIFNDIDYNNPQNAIRRLKIKNDLYSFKILSPLILKEIRFKTKLRNREKYIYSNKNSIMDDYYDKYNNPKHISILRSHLNELKEIQSQRNVKIIFVIIPIFYDFKDKRNNAINNVVYGMCIENQLICIDMLKVFKSHRVNDVKENDGDIWHPNELGIELIADEIYKNMINS